MRFIPTYAISTFTTLALIVAALIMAPSTNAQNTAPQYKKGQVLVKFASASAEKSVAAAHKAKLGELVGDTGVRILRVPEGAEQKVVTALSHNPQVELAELDTLYSASSVDEYFPNQWALENTGQGFTSLGRTVVAAGTQDADIDAPEAWVVTRGTGMKVAVIDSGVATDNPDLTGKVEVEDEANFSGASSGVDDIYGHGTHVAGTIAATADNGVGVAGVCPDCKIVNAKVLNDQGWGSSSAIANGISWSVTRGAKVLNMSIGSDTPSKTIQSAVDNAWRKGVVLVAAAGNDGSSAKDYPAAYNNVIAVAATDNNDKKASFSNYGTKWVDVAAPGVNIYGTFPCHDFFLAQKYGRARCFDVANGTSMASPNAAGVVALAWAAKPNASNATVRAKVESSADKIIGTGSYWSKGRVNAATAVRW